MKLFIKTLRGWLQLFFFLQPNLAKIKWPKFKLMHFFLALYTHRVSLKALEIMPWQQRVFIYLFILPTINWERFHNLLLFGKLLHNLSDDIEAEKQESEVLIFVVNEFFSFLFFPFQLQSQLYSKLTSGWIFPLTCRSYLHLQ